MNIIGHAAILNFFEKVRANQTVAHAYLFVGPDSVGKAPLAARFLNELVDLPLPATAVDPWRNLRTWPDYVSVERESDQKSGKKKKNISVDQIRALRERLGMGSLLSSWKIGVVGEAEALSTEAANALLKTLEEPSGKAILVLLASSAGAVPATIRSRCQIIQFRLVPEREIREGLLALGEETSRAEEFAALAAGRPGRAFRLRASPEEAAAETAAAEAFADLLGAPAWRRIAFAETSAPGKGSAEAVDEALATLRIWEAVLRDALMIASGEPALVRYLPLRNRLAGFAAKKNPVDLARALQAAAAARAAIRDNVPPRLALEHLLLAA